MKRYKNFWIPDDDISTARAIDNEWTRKHKDVLSVVKNKGTVVQAGGNFGLFPLGLREHFDRVITFEPVTESWECLQKNLESTDITCYNLGLSSRSGYANIDQVFLGNPGATRLCESDNGDMKLTTIDDLNLDQLDLLWLDVEGFEVKAIEGGLNTIRKFKPVIVLENNGLIHGMEGNLDGSPKLADYMLTLGYIKRDRLMRDDLFVPI